MLLGALHGTSTTTTERFWEAGFPAVLNARTVGKPARSHVSPLKVCDSAPDKLVEVLSLCYVFAFHVSTVDCICEVRTTFGSSKNNDMDSSRGSKGDSTKLRPSSEASPKAGNW